MTKLVSPPEAARLIGVNPERVREWARRTENPLPSVLVGKGGRHRKIIADEIPAWLTREAERESPKLCPR